MSGVLGGINVLDLSWGVAGPMTAMLLADHGATVTRVESPDRDPFGRMAGYAVWNRGKRTRQLDLRHEADRAACRSMIKNADVLLESFTPGVTAALGLDFDTVRHLNPKLIYCSITGYGRGGPHSQRPGYEALVAARTGHQWEGRGRVGGTLAHLAGAPPLLDDPGLMDRGLIGAPREGPLFSGVPWLSLGAFYSASVAISAALFARASTGRGQLVETSLLQGAMASAIYSWQKVERPDAANYQSWVIDPRAPKGFYRCKDGRWVHMWVPLPSFVMAVAQAESLLTGGSDMPSPRTAHDRIGLGVEETYVLQHYDPIFVEAFSRFDSADWVVAAAAAGVPLQLVRSPEEALADQVSLTDGCVIELPDHAGIPRPQVGHVYRLRACPVQIGAAAGTTTRVDKNDPDPDPDPGDGTPGRTPSRAVSGRPPLEDITVLDLGVAAAGPFGTQLLSDLGANVVKISSFGDEYWMSTHFGMSVNRGKRSILMDLKTAEGRDILYKMVERADIFHHNMRYEAAIRLGVDYESVRTRNSSVIYCHTRGFDTGPRDSLPGNDQTAAALTGIDWVEGGLDGGGTPIWPITALGDTGNGFLSAIAVIQALYHRQRTGRGQFVDTSILYAHLLNASAAWLEDVSSGNGGRVRMDATQLGLHALYRLYQARDGWICVAVLTPEHWTSLCAALDRGDLLSDVRFLSEESRHQNDKDLTFELEAEFANRSAVDCFERLDGHGVPVEISSEDFPRTMLDDDGLVETGMVATHDHPSVGGMRTGGLLFSLSDTPARLGGPPFVPGQHTREVLTDLGFGAEEIDGLLERRVVGIAT